MSQRPTTISVKADAPSTFVGEVASSQRLTFSATGRWKDGAIPAGPEGYRNFIRDMLDFRPREPAHRWLCLMGRVDYADGGHHIFPIGRGRTETFKAAGRLHLFANDIETGYDGNRGSISVTFADGGVGYISADEDGATFKGLLGAWQRFRQAAGRTSGIVFIAALLVATGVLLDWLPQGRDLLRTIGEPLPTSSASDPLAGSVAYQRVAFFLTLTFMAIQAWYWARLIIESNYGSNRDLWHPRPLLTWIPRGLGLGAFAVAIIGLAVLRNWPLLIVAASLAIAFLVGVTVRRSLVRRLPFSVTWLRRTWVIGGWAGAVVVMAIASLEEVNFGWTVGAPGVVFLAVAFLIPPLTTAIQIGSGVRFPTVAVAVGFAALFSLWVDNHVIGARHLSAPAGPFGKPPRIRLVDAYEQWLSHQQAVGLDGSTMVLVASEGGASRAGYWTAEVLSALHDRSGGRLADDLFAIDSVSGGSVGAVGYGAVLHAHPSIAPDEVRGPLTTFAGQDALSPVLTGLLYPDLLQRFLPITFLPDRAQGLEQAWEQGWDLSCGSAPNCRGLLRTGFSGLAPTGGSWAPLLIVQGAREEDGRPILTTRLHFSPSELDADSFFGVTKRDVAISSAIHNGARFPYVSPAGSLIGESKLQGHVVDGGYFDASGTEMTRQLADAVRRIAAGDQCSEKHKDACGAPIPPHRPLCIITIFIGFLEKSAPAHPSPECAGEAPATASPTLCEPTRTIDQPKPASFMNDVVAPLKAIWSARTAVGYGMMRSLRIDASAVREPVGERPKPRDLRTAPPIKRLPYDPYVPSFSETGDYVPIILTDGFKGDDISFSPPMDWALSPAARGFMHSTAACVDDGHVAFSPYARYDRAAIDYVALRLTGRRPTPCALR